MDSKTMADSTRRALALLTAKAIEPESQLGQKVFIEEVVDRNPAETLVGMLNLAYLLLGRLENETGVSRASILEGLSDFLARIEFGDI